MPIITFKHEGRIYQRVISKKQGFYVMESKGLEYWFGKDFSNYPSTHGWHIVKGRSLPDFMMVLLSDELQRLSMEQTSV